MQEAPETEPSHPAAGIQLTTQEGSEPGENARHIEPPGRVHSMNGRTSGVKFSETTVIT